MTEEELDRILTLEWPAVIRWANRNSDEWISSFALSIAGKGKRRKWHPSPKQERVMRRLLTEQKADDEHLLRRELQPALIEE